MKSLEQLKQEKSKLSKFYNSSNFGKLGKKAQKEWLQRYEKLRSQIYDLEKGKNKLVSVLVQFKNPKFNYVTSMASHVTQEIAEAYFVGNLYDVGLYNREVLRKVISVKVLD
jgi:hypothetical protein